MPSRPRESSRKDLRVLWVFWQGSDIVFRHGQSHLPGRRQVRGRCEIQGMLQGAVVAAIIARFKLMLEYRYFLCVVSRCGTPVALGR